MKTFHNPEQFQREMEKRRRQKTIGFVPTMGALHEGHLSLVRRARRENQIVVVSLFVNPLQFGPREDFKKYPRTFKRDRALLAGEKVDFLFMPSAASFYPGRFQTFVEVINLSRGLCGRFRPGHFRGVATVAAKLFNLVRPHRAYFGTKDYQQAVLIKRMARDLNFNLEVKLLPTIRDQDGLALSSRNAYLTPKERARALSISRSLVWAQREIRQGRRNLRRLRRGILRELKRGLSRVDYVEFAEPETLQPVGSVRGRFVIAVAGWVGKTRLIDNAIMQRKTKSGKRKALEPLRGN